MNRATCVTILSFLFVLLASGCARTTIYEGGQPIATFQGNMTHMKFTRSPAGAIKWEAENVSHSTATLAGARAISSVTLPAASVLTTNQFAP